MDGWYGVDLDGCLAFYDKWGDGSIGEPIPAMLERVKKWVGGGIAVRIVTARVNTCKRKSEESGFVADTSFADNQKILIQEWCKAHIGVILPITDCKDFEMIELWDDRVVPVEKNTGRVLHIDRLGME